MSLQLPYYLLRILSDLLDSDHLRSLTDFTMKVLKIAVPSHFYAKEQ